jgi:hypothetical protein
VAGYGVFSWVIGGVTRRILIQTSSIARLAADIAHQRLFHQRLIGPGARKPEEVVEGLLAVQAQDLPAARWGVAQRLDDGDDAAVAAACDAGRILRTHVLRPTWHLVAPDDIRWLLELSAPRVRAQMAYMDRQHDLDEVVFRRAGARIVRALEDAEDGTLTREQLGAALAAARIEAEGTRLAHLVMRAELDGLICSGPTRGKTQTYALLAARAPRARVLRRDEALAELALRYLRGHGPAQAGDLAWWSGLTVAEAKKAIEMAGPTVESETVGDKVYHRARLGSPAPRRSSVSSIQLLPNFDELVIGFKDRDVTLDDELVERAPSDWLETLRAHFVARNGRIVGSWRRELGKEDVRVQASVLVTLSDDERRALEKAARRYARSVGLALVLELECPE